MDKETKIDKRPKIKIGWLVLEFIGGILFGVIAILIFILVFPLVLPPPGGGHTRLGIWGDSQQIFQVLVIGRTLQSSISLTSCIFWRVIFHTF